jgi:hypothetical protein
MRHREIDQTVSHSVIGLKRRRAHMEPFHLVFRHKRGDFPNQEFGEGIAGQELRSHCGAAVANPARAGDIPKWPFGLICREERHGAGETRTRCQSPGENRTAAQSMHDDFP